jgi:exopolysaccharide biosynthesis polyprenyl glycosylphosphotransferase
VGDKEVQLEHLRDLGNIEEFDEIIYRHEIDEVVFALPKVHSNRLENLLKKCASIGLSVKIVPNLLDSYPAKQITVESLMGIPMLSYTPGNISAAGLFYKRILDLFGGFVGFALLAIIFPAIAIMIKTQSPGPVFFRQIRIGRTGRQFNLYKFRTMVVDAESKLKELLKLNEMQGPMFKLENDPRITKIGHFLRKTSLDEFPQFINVLKGEMSLVGTRPPTPNEVEQYEDWQRRRISTRPGITGLWQVSGRNKISDFSEVVRLDLEYIDTWRFIRDIVILWRTILVVLARKGAL